MSVWAIADLHLSFGVKDKEMDVFGVQWENYTKKIEKNWRSQIANDDLVLIAGDISWAMHPEDAIPDLEWIDTLPGTKVMIRGNHDFWWTSLAKLEKILPPSIHLIQNNAFHWKNVAVAGARLWDSSEYRFNEYVDYVENAKAKKLTVDDKNDDAERIFLRDMNRLETSLKCMRKDASYRLVMTHYPPINATLQESRVSKLLKKYHINTCVFGHLHNIKKSIPLFGEKNGIKYFLTACDYLDFSPIRVV
jgi:uncharacterized protein